jgi:hypothetical protein
MQGNLIPKKCNLQPEKALAVIMNLTESNQALGGSQRGTTPKGACAD